MLKINIKCDIIFRQTQLIHCRSGLQLISTETIFKGEKTMKCPICKGKGKEKCFLCHGKGTTGRTIRKSGIHILKNVEYDYVWDVCPVCNGAKKITCRTCYGTGIVADDYSEKLRKAAGIASKEDSQ